MFSIILSTSQLYAQNGITISGQVNDEENNGIPGVNIIEDGTGTGTVTDIDGKFSLKVKSTNSILIFSFIGYSSQKITVGNQTALNVSLQLDETSLDEVVVVGYGTQTKETVTGAVVAVQGKDLVKSQTMNLSSSLAGRLPGVVVIQSSSEPGSDDASISIRGRGTLGATGPLVVVDGIPDRDGGLSRISGQDIESVSVLKDASAAIYGARAANGAIIVTTKRGTKDKFKVSYNFNQGWQAPTVIPKMANAEEYANISNELAIYGALRDNPEEWSDALNSLRQTGSYQPANAGQDVINAPYTSEAIELHRNGTDPWGHPDTDWFGDAFKDWAPQQRHHVSLRGGTENINTYASFGYVSQDAIYKNSATYFNQYNFRVNLDAKVNDYVTVKTGIMFRNEERNFPTEAAGSIFRMLMRGRPTEPEFWPNGLPGPDIENGQNPAVITTGATGFQQNSIDYLQVNASVDITNPWIEGLKLTISGARDTNRGDSKIWQIPWELYTWDGSSYEPGSDTPLLVGSVRSLHTDPRLREVSGSLQNSNLTALLNYNRTINLDHTIGILVGATREEFETRGIMAYRRNFISTAVPQLFAGGNDPTQETGGSASESARLGYYGRIQYDYKEKYLAEVIWRVDGSSAFPDTGGDRYGFFPGVLAGWNISNEDFFNVTGVNFLKLRASYGVMGNDEVAFRQDDGSLIYPQYAYLSTYAFGEYPINSAVQKTVAETLLSNRSFTWETAKNFNLGLDGILFDGKIDFVLEYFRNTRDHILIRATGSTPASSGISNFLPPINAGEVFNTGFDFNIGYHDETSSGISLDVTVGGGYNHNEIVFMDEVPGIPEYQKQEGKSIGGHLVYLFDGVFVDQSDIDATLAEVDYSGVGNINPGDMKIRDYDGNGVIDADDRYRMDESIIPNFTFGSSIDLGYKNFDLSILFQGAVGGSIRVQTESGEIGNFLAYDYDNRWSIDNPSSTSPRLANRGDTYYTGGNYGNNSYWLHSTDYVRLKNIELGYTIPQSIIDKLKLSEFRVYLNGSNLLTLTGNDIFDPESTSGNGVNYPNSKIINAGFVLTF